MRSFRNAAPCPFFIHCLGINATLLFASACLMRCPSHAAAGDAGSSIAIPPLFRPRPRPGSLVALCQKASRSAWLDEQSETVLSQDELEAIWFMLKEESTDDGCDQEMLRSGHLAHVQEGGNGRGLRSVQHMLWGHSRVTH